MSTPSTHARWSIGRHIAAAVGDTTLVAAPGAGRRLVVQKITINIVTAAAQAFNMEDSSATVVLMTIPASAAAQTIIMDYGDLGVELTANNGFVFNTAAAGVVLNIGAYGYYKEA